MKKKCKLTIVEDVDLNLYATLSSLNGRMIWKTSESYTRKAGLLKALGYLTKPDVIIIKLPNFSPNFIKRLEMNLDLLW